MPLTLTLPTPLEAALAEEAGRRGISPEALAVHILRRKLAPHVPLDDWGRRLFAIGIDCGMSVPDSALSSDGLYD